MLLVNTISEFARSADMFVRGSDRVNFVFYFPSRSIPDKGRGLIVGLLLTLSFPSLKIESYSITTEFVTYKVCVCFLTVI